MKTTRLLLMLPALLGLVFAGCIFKPKSDPTITEIQAYPEDLSHPDSVITQLEISYRRRQIEEYATLLADDFIFVFNEDDVTPDIPGGIFNKEQDSLSTKGIFEAVQVTDVRIDLTWGEPEAAVTTAGEDAQRIVILDTFLDVDLDGGATTLRVDGDVQHYFFQQGDLEQGEDDTRWYLVEWRDLGNAGGTGAPERRVETLSASGRPVEYLSMGQLMQRLNAIRKD